MTAETPPAAPRGRPLLLLLILLPVSVVLVLVFGLGSTCIVEGTEVDTPGGPVKIERLAAGDAVWTGTPSGSREPGRVVRTWSARASHHLEITLEDGATLRATALHPVATPGGWCEAGALRVGDLVRRCDGWAPIASIRSVRTPVRVFDLQVEPNSTFYASGVLVHNKSTMRASNERNATASLWTLATAEADFRGNDRDENKIADYWVGDVAGLYRLRARNEPLRLIEESIAGADAAPLPAGPGRFAFAPLPDAQPKAGYRYRMIPLDGRGKPYAEDLDGDGKSFESARGFAICAYPDRPPKGGLHTFIVNQDGTIWRKDSGGKPVDRWPAEPAAEGWRKED